MSDKYFSDKPPAHMAERLERFQEKRNSCRFYVDKNFEVQETHFKSNVNKHVMLKPEEIENIGSGDE